MRAVFLLPLFVLVPLAAADDRDRDEAAEAEKLFAAELPRWKFTAGEVALDNPKEPALRWTNPDAGRVNGNLIAPGSVELPAQSQVKGDVRAKSVSVHGAVEGNVVAEQKVELGPAARLQGDVTCTALVIAEGAVFQGRSIMAKTPSA